MGRYSRGTRWGEYGYREPGEKRCLMNLNVAGPAERSLPTTSGSNIRPSLIGSKSGSDGKGLGLGLTVRSEPGAKKQAKGTDPMVGNDGRCARQGVVHRSEVAGA